MIEIPMWLWIIVLIPDAILGLFIIYLIIMGIIALVEDFKIFDKIKK